MRLIFLATLTALACGAAQAGTLIPVPQVPGSAGTSVLAINDNNQIAGVYIDLQFHQHAFFGTLDGNYTTFDYEGNGTQATGIDNKGDVVGYSNFMGHSPCNFVPFERNAAGQLSTIRHRKKLLSGYLYIDTHGLLTGSYCNKRGDQVVYDGKKGKFKLSIPIHIDSDMVAPTGVNSAGTHVGVYYDSKTKTQHGFLYMNGTTTFIDYPDPAVTNTQLTGLNEKGIALGVWNKGDPQTWFGFTLDTNTGTFDPLDIPGATDVLAYGLNKAGLIALDTNVGPYVYCPDGAQCPH